MVVSFTNLKILSTTITTNVLLLLCVWMCVCLYYERDQVSFALFLNRAFICKDLFHILANISPISPLSSFKTFGWMPSRPAIYLYLVCAFLYIRYSASNSFVPRDNAVGIVFSNFLFFLYNLKCP